MVAILFVTSMVFTLLNQPAKAVVGSVYVGRKEAYWLNMKRNSSTTDSFYMINYAIEVTNSSDKLTITDKVEKNMTQIVITPDYSNVQTSYDSSTGEVKVEVKKLVSGENYSVQVAFQAPIQAMFEGEAPATTCSPAPIYGYTGLLEVEIAPFKLIDTEDLKEVDIYGWFTTLVTEKSIVSSDPAAESQPPEYWAIWMYKSPATEYSAHKAVYDVKINPDLSAGVILLRTWIEADYQKNLLIFSNPTFSGAEVTFKNIGSAHILQYEYTIG